MCENSLVSINYIIQSNFVLSFVLKFFFINNVYPSKNYWLGKSLMV